MINCLVVDDSAQQDIDSRELPVGHDGAMSFVLENDSSLIPPLIAAIQAKLVGPCLEDDDESMRVGVALEEALSNALYHGNLEISSSLKDHDDRAFYVLADSRRVTAPYKDRRIFVDAQHDESNFTVVIRDEGPGFDPQALPDPTDLANLERPHGRGLLLIRAFMDHVEHNALGNEITLQKRRRTRELRPRQALR